MTDSVRGRLDRGQILLSPPYHRWLGLEVRASGPDEISIRCPWVVERTLRIMVAASSLNSAYRMGRRCH